MLIRFTILTLIAAVLSACSDSASENLASLNPSIPYIATGFTNFSMITKTSVLVNPELAMLCVGASQEAVEAARIQYGPHAHTGILIYMNKLAEDAFAKNSSPFPLGAVIVKEKQIFGYRGKDMKWVPSSGKNGVGGMVKRAPGYDPMHGDWEYFYFENAAKIESGPIPACVKCHDAAKPKDFVFGTWRKAGG